MKQRNLKIRTATLADLPHVVRLIAEDDIVGWREHLTDPLPANYIETFRTIEADLNNELIVAEMDGTIIGTLQITYIPYIINRGGWRALIEALMISSEVRSNGIGTAMMNWAIDRARERGCCIVQLTSNKQRPQAHRFYERLGFKSHHEGFKLQLEAGHKSA